jgi:hypothetical protein
MDDNAAPFVSKPAGSQTSALRATAVFPPELFNDIQTEITDILNSSGIPSEAKSDRR